MNLSQAKKALEQLKTVVDENKLNIYDVSIECEEGIVDKYYSTCNVANNSYSVTKLYINTAIGILIDEDVLNLEDKVVDILKDDISISYDPIWKEVSIAHCLGHNMGIDKGVLDSDCDDINTYDTDDFLQRALEYPPKFKPGTYRLYTDVPHYLLSRVITKKTGRIADEFITDRLLNPCHYEATAFYRCPYKYTIGATGMFARSKDTVKLATLYLNKGLYHGQRYISESFVILCENKEYDIYKYGQHFLGKTGMLGQMVMYNREKNYAVAWHSCGKDGHDKPLIDFFDKL
jgi:CubicO group peptidase (beta-lactamase class C family)